MLTQTQRRRLLWLGFILVLIVAACFRLWRLHSIPPGLFGDEAADALDALDVLAGRGQVFFPGNFGREGLHMWIIALAIKLLGLTPYALRLPSAIAGVITAIAAYWLGVELFIAPLPARASAAAFRKAWLIALGAGLFTAISYWHIHFSRFGIRGVFTTTMAALTMAALWRAINKESLLWWAVAGAFMGVGAHFYTASRFIPLFAGLFLGGWLLFSIPRGLLTPPIRHPRRFIIGASIFFGVSALIFAPLAVYFLRHPGSFTQRASEVSAFQNGLSLATFKIIGRAAGLNLLQFIWPGHGDLARFYNLPGRAVFMPATALLALLGLGVSLRNWRNPRYSFLLLWFLILVSPSFLAVDRAPTLPRVLGVIPGVFFFPAIGLAAGLDWLNARWRLPSAPLKTALLGSLAALLFLLPAAFTYRDYFQRWGPAPQTADAFEIDMTTAWRWLEAHPAPGPLYISADIYRHLTFILLYEKTPTTQFFTRRSPNLHWFDARRAWPLPRPGSEATIIVGSSATPPADIQSSLGIHLAPLDSSAAYLASADIPIADAPAIWFDPHLGLIRQTLLPPSAGQKQGRILQLWRTRGPIPDDFEPWQIQSALLGADGSQLVQVSDEMGMRAPEWEPDGFFITWQSIPWPAGANISGVALRLTPHNRAPLHPAGADVDGWLTQPLP